MPTQSNSPTTGERRLHDSLARTLGDLQILKRKVRSEAADGLHHKEFSPEERIEAAIAQIRAVARQYHFEELARTPLRNLKDSLARHPNWKVSLKVVLDAYRVLASDDADKRPFLPGREIREEFRRIRTTDECPGVKLSSSEILSLFHREGFLEKQGTLSGAAYRPAPHVTRLIS